MKHTFSAYYKFDEMGIDPLDLNRILELANVPKSSRNVSVTVEEFSNTVHRVIISFDPLEKLK